MQNTELFIGKKIHYSVFFNISAHTQQDKSKSNTESEREEINRITELRYKEDLNALNQLFNYQNNQLMTNPMMYKCFAVGLLDAPLIGLPTYGDFNILLTEKQKQQFIDVYKYVKNLLIHASLEGPCSIFLPLGLPSSHGVHIDHFMLREALLMAVHELGEHLTCDIYFGEDQPYIGNNQSGAEMMINQLTTRLGLQPISYGIDPEAKYNTVAKNYPSQLRVPAWQDAIVNRAKALGNCERVYLLPQRPLKKFHVDPLGKSILL